MQKCSSGKTMRREGGFTLHGVEHKTNQLTAAGLHHPRQESDEDGRTGCKSRHEDEDFLVMPIGDCADGVIQNTLFGPTGGQFLMLGLGSLLPNNIGGTMNEELTEGVGYPFI